MDLVRINTVMVINYSAYQILDLQTGRRKGMTYIDRQAASVAELIRLMHLYFCIFIPFHLILRKQIKEDFLSGKCT
jgi:hypothetical protein